MFQTFTHQLLVKNYSNALRYKLFNQHKNSRFLIWKLNLTHAQHIPSLKSLQVRSFYTRKKNLKGYLLNLFLCTQNWQIHSYNWPIKPYQAETAPGWGIGYQKEVDIYSELYKLVYEQFFEKNKVLYSVPSKKWLSVEPKAWISLSWDQLGLLGGESGASIPGAIEEYFLVDGAGHGLQYKINIKTANLLPLWYSKTLSLRLLKYPVVYQRQTLPLLSRLHSFGLRQDIPWDLVLESKNLAQSTPKAKKILLILQALVSQPFQGYLTEYLVYKRLKLLVESSNRFSQNFFKSFFLKV